MKLRSKILLTGICLAFVTSAFACKDNSCTTYVTGGEIRPGQKISLKIDRLPSSTNEVYYNLRCDIQNPNYNKQNPVVIKAWISGAEGISINGSRMIHDQAKLSKLTNKLVVQGARVYRASNNSCITPSETIIQNIDECDTIMVENCIAEIASN